MAEKGGRARTYVRTGVRGVCCRAAYRVAFLPSTKVIDRQCCGKSDHQRPTGTARGVAPGRGACTVYERLAECRRYESRRFADIAVDRSCGLRAHRAVITVLPRSRCKSTLRVFRGLTSGSIVFTSAGRSN